MEIAKHAIGATSKFVLRSRNCSKVVSQTRLRISSSEKGIDSFQRPEIRRRFSSAVEARIISSDYNDVAIPNVAFGDYILERLEKFWNKISMVNGDTGETWTYADVVDRSRRLASALTRLDLQKGDTIAIVAPNCPEFLVSFIAVSLIGATSTTLNTSYTTDEIIKQLQDSEAVAIITQSMQLNKIRDVKISCKKIRHLICIDKEEEGVIHMNKLFKDDAKGIPCQVKIDPGEDILVLPYSSGTTGLPKGVMLTHTNIIANIEQMFHPNLSTLKTTGETDEVFVGILPMFHIYGMVAGMLTSAICGGKMITLKAFDPKQYLQMLEKYKPTFLHTVPPILSFLTASEDAAANLLQSTHSIICGAAPVGSVTVKKFLNKFGTGINFQEGYGMTEASPVTHLTPKNKLIIGSCGSAIPNTLTKFIDVETGHLVDATCSEGELCVKGPQVMKGYFKNQQATDSTIIDGWLHTGDIARIDKDNNVYIVDRLKELIKVKGLQVAPAELENILRQHPSIADVAVIGIADERSGELPKAFIVPSKSVTEEEIKTFIAGKVAPHKRLEGGVEFIDKIPKSDTGKILRRMLK